MGLVHVELEGVDSLQVMRGRLRNYRHELRRKYGLPVLPLCISRHLGLQGLGWDEDKEVFFMAHGTWHTALGTRHTTH